MESLDLNTDSYNNTYNTTCNILGLYSLQYVLGEIFEENVTVNVMYCRETKPGWALTRNVIIKQSLNVNTNHFSDL